MFLVLFGIGGSGELPGVSRGDVLDLRARDKGASDKVKMLAPCST